MSLVADRSAHSAEAWLIEWAGWSRAAPFVALAGEQASDRAARCAGLRPDKPRGDGNMLRNYLAQGEREQMDRRARRVQTLVHEMPAHMRRLLSVTYLSPCESAVLPRRAAALRLGINETAYRIQKAQVLGWIAGRLGMLAEAQ